MQVLQNDSFPIWAVNPHWWWPFMGVVPLWGKCPLSLDVRCSLLRGVPLWWITLWAVIPHWWWPLMGVVSSLEGVNFWEVHLMRDVAIWEVILYDRFPVWAVNPHWWWPLMGVVPFIWGRCPLLEGTPYERCGLLRGVLKWRITRMSSESTLVVTPYGRVVHCWELHVHLMRDKAFWEVILYDGLSLLWKVSTFGRYTWWEMWPFERWYFMTDSPYEQWIHIGGDPLWELCPLYGGGVHFWKVHLMRDVAFWEVFLNDGLPVWAVNPHWWWPLMGELSTVGS